MLRIVTDHPIAVDSPDTLKPLGTARDNTVNPRFNAKLEQIVTGRPMRIIDLGCAGGGFVQTLVEAGHLAVGVEGSDYSLRHKRAAWGVIPGNLFTGDITKPFKIMNGKRQARFDAATAFEVLEHIHRKDLPGLFANLRQNLKPGGLLIGSVNTYRNSTMIYHQTVEERKFWIDLFVKQGFRERADLEKVIGTDWLRMPGRSFGIVAEYAEAGNG